MNWDGQKLLSLLPVLYRLRDEETISPELPRGKLQAFLDTLATQANGVRKDVDRLYDNQFIETCDEWLVPYLGDLLGVRGLHTVGNGSLNPRAVVANTLAYRRRKGTASVLEQLARDTTSWDAVAVEFFQSLGWTQHLNHLRPQATRTPNLRDTAALEEMDGPFASVHRTVEVRRAAVGGRYNISNVGLFLYRLQAYTVREGEPTRVAAGRFRMSPLGQDIPLFYESLPEEKIEAIAKRQNVSDRLRRRPLFDEVEAGRQALARGDASVWEWFRRDHPAFRIYVNGVEVPPEQMMICNLEAWQIPPALKSYPDSAGSPVDLPIALSIDPKSGRMAFPTGVDPSSLRVTYAYGFPGNSGAGSYSRRRDPRQLPASDDCPENPVFNLTDTVANPLALGRLIQVFADKPAGPHPDAVNLTDALALWVSEGKPRAVIQIEDSRIYNEDCVLPMSIGELTLQAKEGCFPVCIGNLRITEGGDKARLVVNGLCLSGNILVTGILEELFFLHTTLVPGLKLTGDGTPLNPHDASLTVQPASGDASDLSLVLYRTVCGPLRIPKDVRDVQIWESLLDSPDPIAPVPALCGIPATTEPGPNAIIVGSTVLGSVHVQSATYISDSLFTQTFMAERLQTGCARFSYFTDHSRVPRRYRCQPEQAVLDGIHAAIKPFFTDRRFGQPAYLQLSQGVDPVLKQGGSNEAEIGGWNFLLQPQREGNLRQALEEYLRLGLEPAILYMT